MKISLCSLIGVLARLLTDMMIMALPTGAAIDAFGCSTPCRLRKHQIFSRRQNKRMSQTGCAYPRLADELLIVRNSGEIPEVALYGSLYYLTCDLAGPRLVLSEVEVLALKRMVVERYREIIGRDLEPANRDLSLYRGLARAAVNWRRLEKFCQNEGLEVDVLRGETRTALLTFLQREAAEVAAATRTPSINCPAEELRAFAQAVQLSQADLPPGWKSLCPAQPAESSEVPL